MHLQVSDLKKVIKLGLDLLRYRLLVIRYQGLRRGGTWGFCAGMILYVVAMILSNSVASESHEPSDEYWGRPVPTVVQLLDEPYARQVNWTVWTVQRARVQCTPGDIREVELAVDPTASRELINVWRSTDGKCFIAGDLANYGATDPIMPEQNGAYAALTAVLGLVAWFIVWALGGKLSAQYCQFHGLNDTEPLAPQPDF